MYSSAFISITKRAILKTIYTIQRRQNCFKLLDVFLTEILIIELVKNPTISKRQRNDSFLSMVAMISK